MKKFRALVTEYVREIAEDGFPDAPRMESVLMQLRAAADREFVSEEKMRQSVDRALRRRFKQAVSKSRIERTNPGIPRTTIDSIMPELRDNLDRRILANASMIKINRDQAIEKTLQRFSGWMSSVPVGGTDAVDVRDVVTDITKTQQKLKFEVRRREIDQGHKLMAAIDETLAEQTGAIAAEWHSHWRQKNYDYRKDHKERDGKIYVIRDGWAYKKGLIKKGAGFTDEITKPNEEVYCRCYYTYLRTLRDLPEDMLTAKGQKLLEKSNAL